jgi:hypothetical protein
MHLYHGFQDLRLGRWQLLGTRVLVKDLVCRTTSGHAGIDRYSFQMSLNLKSRPSVGRWVLRSSEVLWEVASCVTDGTSLTSMDISPSMEKRGKLALCRFTTNDHTFSRKSNHTSSFGDHCLNFAGIMLLSDYCL